MKKNSLILAALCALLTLSTSCGSSRQISYLQNEERLNFENQQPYLYDARIFPKDLLTITVNCSEPQLSAPFNQGHTLNMQSSNLPENATLPGYLVDNSGNIDFPILGKLHLGGLTKAGAENLLREKLTHYLKEKPVISVRISNYKFSVLGEVSRPGSFSVTSEKVNLFEALAMAGDLTIQGKRGNIKLLREDELGRKIIIKLDLKDPFIVNSPYYYLQQNDILYIEPNKAKASGANISPAVSFWLGITSTLVTVTNLIITLTR